MNKIKVHRYENPQWGRYHLPFFKKFDTYLSQFFDLKIVNYNKDGNTSIGKINLLKSIGPQFGKTPAITDVENILENTQTGEIKIISCTEYYTSYVMHLAKAQHCSNVLLSHFNWHNLYHWSKQVGNITDIYKVKPWIFLPFFEFDVQHYRQLRKTCGTLNSKMFYKGSGISDYRKMILYLQTFGSLQDTNPTNNKIDYLDLLSKSRIAVSYYTSLSRYQTPFDYPGEFCYRDIEYQLLGVPYIRIEYKDTLHNPLLPNQHYISIPREDAIIAFERTGDLGVAELYQKTYENVIKDNYFLDYISKNQIKWSDENLLYGNAEKLTFDLLHLKDWLN